MRKNKKIVILTGIFLMTLSIVACGQVKEDEFTINQQESDIQTVESTDSEIKGDDTVTTEESSANQQENSTQTVESINPDTFPVGEYHDDMGSQLIISKVDDKNYTIEYGIYKLMYTENAVGSYDVNTGILSFSGTDISTESTLSADVTIQGNNLIVTLTNSEFPDCPTGTVFEFEPSQP
ncbi:MAG: hypothetical protein K2H41_07410 [Acetatifactor sp.]|nr:hypothetical protein [Acetatifactor sp.]